MRKAVNVTIAFDTSHVVAVSNISVLVNDFVNLDNFILILYQKYIDIHSNLVYVGTGHTY